MSTELDIFQQGTAVATTGPRDDGFTSNVGGSSITSRSIVIVNNRLRVMVNGKELMKIEQPYLDVIIVNSAPTVNRMFYSEGYDPKAAKRSPPKCWSHDSAVPAPESREPQGTKCVDCPQNIKGSGPNGTKACRFHRYIAVVLADNPTGDIYRVKLSATSVFGDGTNDRRPFHAYRDYLVANNEGLGTVVSRMIVGDDNSNIGFRPVGRLTDEQVAVIRGRSQEEDAVRAITMSVAADRDENGEEFAPASTPAPTPAPAPAPQAAPVATAPADEDIPEPTVRSTKPAPAPTQAAPAKVDGGEVSLDDLVADWT